MNDDVYEGTEGLSVTIDGDPTTPAGLVQFAYPDGTTCEPSCATTPAYPVTITDEEDRPELSLVADPASIAEEDDSATTNIAENVSTLAVSATNAKTFATDQVITLTFSGAADYGTHYSVTPTDADGAAEGHQVTLPAETASVSVTVTAAANDTNDGNRIVSVAGDLDGTGIGSTTITIVDDDATTTAPEVTVSETALTVTEEDATGNSYTVALETQPTADVVVTVAGHAGTEVTPAPNPLTFTTTNWNTVQTVTVTAGGDADLVNDTVTLTHSAASTDTDYSGITITEVKVTVNDNDTAQVTGVTVAAGNARLVVEWTAVGNATGYKVQWKSGSQGYNATDRQPTLASGSTTSHTIPSLVNGTEYTVRVTATRTDANDGPPSAEKTGTLAAPTAPGVTVSETALTVTEQDTTGNSYTVVFDTQPTADVVVTVAGHAGTDVTATPNLLTFTATNWNTAQTVTVTAGDDADLMNETVTLTHSAVGTDTVYNGIPIAAVTVTVNDNDRSNTPPVFTGGTTQTRTLAETMGGARVGTAAAIGDPVAATDADDEPLTYSLGGTDAGKFDFLASSAQLRTKANERYDFEAQPSYAVTVTVDDGTVSVSAAVTISLTDVDEPPLAPAAPTVTATPNATDSLSVSWSAPSNTGRPAIDSYDLQYREGTTGTWTDGPQNVSGTSTTIAGLAADPAAYQVQVRATNDEGDGPWSPTGRIGGGGGGGARNDPLLAVDDAAETVEGTAVFIDVLANDSDPNGDPLTVVEVSAPAHGGRRVETTGQEESQVTVAGLHVPLGTGVAAAGWAVAERWITGVAGGMPLQSGGRTGMDAAPGAEAVGAPGALGAPAARLGMAGGAPFGEGASPTRSNWSPLSAGGQTEFLLALGRGQAGGGAAPGPHWTVWGQHDQQAFGGERSPAARYDGHLRTAYVGFDGRLSERWLAGVAVSRSRGDGDWTFGSSAGRLTTTLTSVHPYLRWSDGGTIWATAGSGHGSAENERVRYGLQEESALGLRLGLVEVRRRLATVGGGVELQLRGDAAWARLTTAAGDELIDALGVDVHQLRLGIDVSRTVRTAGGTLVEPFGEVHARRDGGSGQTGAGLEVAGGLRVARGVFRVEGMGRLLALHAADGYREHGGAVTLSVGDGARQPGLTLSLSPRWGWKWQLKKGPLRPREKDSPPFSKALAVARSVSTSRTVNRGCQPAALSNEK